MNQRLYDPQGLIEANQPYDREPYASLVKAVLAWTSADDALEPRDYEQIALVLTGHARAVAADVRCRCAGLSKGSDKQRALADVVLAEAHRRLSTPARGTMRCVQNRARLVRALYERLDRLPAVPPSSS
ncbi:restriction endonuclease [Streptomyces samsunensis]|uniref:restriction endonuclease n=1 Tax=Streptomyces malaysiensis TaxID=92644 RepID=UPI0015831005|nr:restriction endonuclease [Streptomyces samsunensis]NUH42871.1 restriction endonuclease [Streptomyces samsunensis]